MSSPTNPELAPGVYLGAMVRSMRSTAQLMASFGYALHEAGQRLDAGGFDSERDPAGKVINAAGQLLHGVGVMIESVTPPAEYRGLHRRLLRSVNLTLTAYNGVVESFNELDVDAARWQRNKRRLTLARTANALVYRRYLLAQRARLRASPQVNLSGPMTPVA